MSEMQEAANTIFRAADIMKQSAIALAEIEAMKAENQQRLIEGKAIAYDEDSFFRVLDDLKRI